MKKILSLVLAMLMIFSVVPAVFAADASEDSAYQEALDFLGKVGFYQGGAGVADDDDITRWQMALFVSRLVTGEVDNDYWATTENDSGFTDVDALEAYMLGAVTFAAQEGIINGYGDGTFGPNDGITYRDALVMTVRALGTKYSASGYPWSYIATARELGLMNEINGIGWTDEITREVVAQILYNAFFAEVKGATVAEKVFGIAKDTVMVTASNRVVYLPGANPVRATNYIQVMVVDEQLEPAGTQYHLPASALELADDNAENGAVGCLYNVWHKDNFKTVVMYEDLNTTYTNREGVKDIELTGNSADNRGLYIYGKYHKFVAEYTNLFNQDRRDRTADGTDELKLFIIGTGGVGGLQTIGTKYVMYPDGWIYQISDLTAVAYYSEFLGRWYKYNADKSYTEIDITNVNDPNYEIYADLHRGNGGFRLGFGLARVNETLAGIENWSNNISGYADLVTSDVDKDGYADRAVLKNYRIGQYDEYYNSDNGKWYFNIYTNGNETYNSLLGTRKDFAGKISADDSTGITKYGVSDELKTDWNIVNAPADGDYIVYYLDTDNKELEVIKTIPAKANATDDDTYWSYGYILGFFQTQNKIYMNDNEAAGTRIPLDIGYDAMYGFGSALHSFKYVSSTSTTDYQISENYRFHSELARFLLDLVEEETYVKYLVLDGNVIAIEDAEADSGDYVIPMEFAEINADGIKLGVWSTVTNSYDTITLAEFNGWDIDGVDWDLLWKNEIQKWLLTGGTLPTVSDMLAKYVPIELGEIYSVVSYDTDKNYNISTRYKNVQEEVDVVVAGGYVHSHASDADDYVSVTGLATGVTVFKTSGVDFWLVKDTTTGEVYARTGKLANVTFGDGTKGGTGVTVYKADEDSRDFVIAGTTAELADFIALADSVGDEDIKYVVYERNNMMQSVEDNEYNPGSYFYQVFTDVITGDPVRVYFDSALERELLAQVKENHDDAATINTIYKIVDGELAYDKTTGDVTVVAMSEVLAVVEKSFTNDPIEVTAAAGDTLAALLAKAVSALELDVLGTDITPDQADANVYISPANVEFVVLDNADSYRYGIRYSGNCTTLGINDNVETKVYANAKAYVFYNDAAETDATTATVYVVWGN